MSFDLDSYVDVPERIRMFAEKYPEGSLQGEGFFVRDVEEKIVGYHYVAKAYRTQEDKRPGVGTAYEPIPGKTPYTRDSEVMNAETSAWGRAIVALGFETKKIASANEVRARQGDGPSVPPAAKDEPASPPGSFNPPAKVQAELERKQASSVPNQDGGVPEEVAITFGKHSGKLIRDLVESESGYLKWLASEKFEPKTKEQRRAKAAAQTVLGQPLTYHGDGVPTDDDIPF